MRRSTRCPPAAGLISSFNKHCLFPPYHSDMMLAQKKVDETKRALAIAYQTAAHIDDKGPQVWGLYLTDGH